MNAEERRAERLAAADQFRPERIKLLLIAEAPPSALDRYFYFLKVQQHDSLFRYVARSVLRAAPTRGNKELLLSRLRDAGVFLIDVCLDPIDDPADLKVCLADVIARAKTLDPDHIILIKATVNEVAYWPMKRAGLPVVDANVPFPGSGHQIRFEVEMKSALDSIGWNTGPNT
jgi:hypothetical protein